MSNPKKHPEPFVPSHLGTQPRQPHSNKGKQMEMKQNDQPDVIQTKGKK
ncbi:acid-soluble spore protein N [Pontibacillus litoralis]|uniref:Small, acid-soluble spore protein N n=1 Tax=Pontibacillus litoralis JSM 072002 TaxID=1385512 RepID=A0A0A5G8X9_9BACI|nr:acid-soluble spore protein N [Pontibacillus litoralis]KGX87555.1 acid-soluble spore protein N [Pontibacillus litoralis JSM 072002]